MNRLGGVIGVLMVLVASMGFAALNGGQRVTLHLGIATLYRVPLTAVAFGALILGMVVMLVAGIQSDLRVRKILRERLAEEDREERARIFVDQTQTNLFDADAEPVASAAADPAPKSAPPATPASTSTSAPASEPPATTAPPSNVNSESETS